MEYGDIASHQHVTYIGMNQFFPEVVATGIYLLLYDFRSTGVCW